MTNNAWKGRDITRIVVALLFIAIGVLHFTFTKTFVAIVPDWLPSHYQLVYISGFFEIAGGLGLLLKATRTAAAYGLILLLIAVFPANANMLQQSQNFPQIPVWMLWLRLPVQVLIIALVYRLR
jgi:uncharacterized membrane protein